MITPHITALITPFTHTGSLDVDALQALIEWQITSSDADLLFLGTTGERMTLSDQEEVSVIETAVRLAKDNRSLIVNTGCNDTLASVEFTKRAQHLGADYALAVVPYYNFPPPRGIIAHFECIAEVGLPLIVYHHPKRTGVFLDIDTLRVISQIPGVCAIKEASGNIEFATQLIQSVDVPVFCGDDPLTLQMMQAGAFGTISVISNLIPEEWSKLINLALHGNIEEAEAICLHYQPLLDALGLEVNPITVKYALSLMQKCAPNLRLPLVMPQQSTQEHIAKVMEMHYPELINQSLELLN